MEPGDVLEGRFELEGHAGAGGMGEVFRAWDREAREAVAVKVLLAGGATDPRRFVREAEVLSALSHPGIVRHIAHGFTPKGEPYLVMEWLSGEDLAERLRRGPLSVEETLTLGRRAARALSAAHERGVVHRDLKPSNLFLLEGEAGHVKVVDFGLARRHGATPITKTGSVMGTPGYIAPEQIRSGGQIDARADVFALGCVLFECLTGAPLFAAEHVVGVLAKILYQEAARASEKAPDVPPRLDALIARMVAKDPSGRPESAAAVVEALVALSAEVTRELEEAPQPKAGVPSSLTGSERRVVSVVLLGPERTFDPAAPTPEEAAISEDARALSQVAEAHGGRLTALSDGAAIVRIGGGVKVATDQATQAARCALALRALRVDRSMALTTGRAEMTGELLVGDVIDRAASMLPRLGVEGERATELVIDEVTAGLLDARFEVVEGEAGLILVGEHPLAEGARTLLGKATACVGREWEIGVLEAFLNECVEESTARAVLVTAPAGMGKSRLAYEFVRRAWQSEDRIAIWSGRVDSPRAGSTFGLLRQVLLAALGVRDSEPLASRRERVEDRVRRNLALAEQQRVAEFLGEIVGTPFPDEESPLLRAARKDAQLMGDQMRGAWLDFLRAESAAQPVVIVLEDLHWGDAPTVRFIDAALREVRATPLLVLALGRPEVHKVFPRLWVERSVQEIRLKELSRRASERLVRQAFDHAVDAETMERIVSQADGHAFYLEELIRAVAEGGKGEALPETLLAMVEARLAGLDGEARRLLRAASVFGEAFWPSGVGELLGVSASTRAALVSPSVEAWLSSLVEHEVLVRRKDSRFPGEVEFAFRHGLLRESAYATLTDEDRSRGHRLAGEWLSREGETDAMVLAEHFDKGGDKARAGGYYLRSAEQASLAGDTAMAIARARLGLACGGPDDRHRAALLGVLCEAYNWQLQTANGAMPYADELLQLSPRGSAPWAQAAFAKIGATVETGQIEECVATLRLVMETAPSSDSAAPLALALGLGANVLELLGCVTEADAAIDRLSEVARAAGEEQPFARLCWNVFVSMRMAYAHEDPFQALLCADAALSLAGTMSFRRLIMGARMSQGMNQWFLGAFEPAERALREAVMADEELGLVTSMRRFSLAWMLADRGAFDAARVTAIELVEYGQARRRALDEARGRWALAEVKRREGDLDVAEAEVERALELFGEVSLLDQPGALATLAGIRLSQGCAAEARSLAEGALSRYEAMGSCGLFRGAVVRLVFAEALRAEGDEEGARAAIGRARSRLLKNADKIGDRTYRESFLANVPENARTLALAREWLGDEALGERDGG